MSKFALVRHQVSGFQVSGERHAFSHPKYLMAES